MNTPTPRRRGRTETEALDAILADIERLDDDARQDEGSDEDCALNLTRPDRFEPE